MNDDVIRAWCGHMRARGLAPATIRRRVSSMGQLAEWVAPVELVAVEVDELEEWLAHQRTQWTRVAYYRDAHAFYGWATARRLIDHSPLEDFPAPEPGKPLPRPLTREQLDHVLALSAGDLRVMVMLGAFAGLRVGEIARLHSDDVNCAGNHPVLVVRAGKGRKDRAVPLHPRLVGALAGRRGFIISRPDGGAYRPGTITKVLGAHLRDCGVVATPHALRHTFGSEVARCSGWNLLVVAELMGHANPDTSRCYIDIGGCHLDVVQDLFGDAA